MRRHYLLALASSASLALLAAAGCSSSDDGPGASPPDGGTPDSSTPNPDDDASTPDGGPKKDAGPHEPGWDPSFSLPGVAGRLAPQISAMARIGNRQIALAGNFEQAGSVPTKFVGLWNGNKWLSIGTGLTEAIDRMVATPSGELFGTVPVQDGTNGKKLFKWDKTAWTEVASFDDHVSSLEVAPDGTLYASGSFTHVGASAIANLAKLSGNTWSEVPDAPAGINVVRIVDGTLCIGGFDTLDVGVQCLESGSWKKMPFTSGYGEIHDIGKLNGEIVAAGRFVVSSDDEAGSLARWTGSAWQLIGGGLEGAGPANVQDMEIDGDKIYVTGNLSFAGGMQVRHVAMWDASQMRWSSLNDGVYGSSGGIGFGPPPGRALVKDQGGEIYVGGQFALIGGRNALGIARWDGNQWNPVDDPKAKRLGVNGGVNALAVDPNGATYVGGGFPLVGGDVAVNNVARFENDAWSALGLGFDDVVMAVAVSGSTVYAGGDFLRSGPVLTRFIGQWNGSSWSSVGAGLDGPVRALAVGPDGNLYAGGHFTEAGGVVANHIAKWDGTKWQAIGDGFDGAVNAIAFDASGKLHAGGGFTKSGEKDVNRIAAWDGSTWSALGTGVAGDIGGTVNAIVFYDGKLTIGGYFDHAGETKVEGIATWNGTAWVPVGGGVQSEYEHSIGTVTSLAVRNKELYVGGLFAHAGGQSDPGTAPTFPHLAMWNGTAWSDVGGGTADAVERIVATKDALWVGGHFTFAGNQGAYNIGRFWFN